MDPPLYLKVVEAGQVNKVNKVDADELNRRGCFPPTCPPRRCGWHPKEMDGSREDSAVIVLILKVLVSAWSFFITIW